MYWLPLPDLVITCNNICNTLLKWYENLAVELDIPCIVIDVPFNHTMPIPEYAKAYIADQFRNAISQLEVICGRPFDWKKTRHSVPYTTGTESLTWLSTNLLL